MSITKGTLKVSNNFTLIELLITIAIIAILAAMLLPALDKARTKAKSISCLNNIKQLYLSVALYMDNNDEYCPVYPPMKTLIDALGEKSVIYQCPADLSAFDMFYALGTGVRYSYAENLSIVTPASVGISGISAVKLSMIKKPSETPFWGEAKPVVGTKYWDPNGTQCSSRNYVYGPGVVGHNCATRHSNGSNYISVAGAAKWENAIMLNSWTMPYWKFKR